MTSPKQELKFAWHVHHNVLVEPLTEPIEDRIAYIKDEKPPKEVPLRLKLLKVVKGKLPEKFVEVWKTYDKVRKAWSKTYKTYVDVSMMACGEVGNTYVEVLEKLEKLKKDYIEVENAWVDALKVYKKEISALHEKECPECPWDGETIFSKKPTTP